MAGLEGSTVAGTSLEGSTVAGAGHIHKIPDVSLKLIFMHFKISKHAQTFVVKGISFSSIL